MVGGGTEVEGKPEEQQLLLFLASKAIKKNFFQYIEVLFSFKWISKAWFFWVFLNKQKKPTNHQKTLI